MLRSRFTKNKLKLAVCVIYIIVLTHGGDQVKLPTLFRVTVPLAPLEFSDDQCEQLTQVLLCKFYLLRM